MNKLINTIHFSGAGWRLFYFLGISKFIQEFYTSKEIKKIKFSGASVGSWISLLLITETPSEKAFKYWCNCAKKQRQSKSILDQIYSGESMENMYSLFNLSDEIILDINQNQRLNVLINKTSKKFVVNTFESIEDLFHALMASAFIPLITRKQLFYKYKNQFCFDGGLRKNSFEDPKLLISINKQKYKNNNIYLNKMLGWSYYPPKRDLADALYSKGYLDSKKYFNEKIASK